MLTGIHRPQPTFATKSAISRNGAPFDHLSTWSDMLANLQPLNVTSSIHSANRAREMNRKLRIGLIVIVAAFMANYAPLLNGHAEQDNCIFGPVSNDDYRTYLGRAKALLPFPTPSLLLDDKAFALKLDDLFDNLSRGETSVYSRLAIMHATLRAVGAE
jgi:hypothetical protein